MQTHVEAMKAAITNKDKHGKDFYTRIGSLGGKVKSPLKGFGKNYFAKSINKEEKL